MMGYKLKLLKKFIHQKPGSVHVVEVFHDDDCPKLVGDGDCMCEPDIMYTSELTGGE